MLVTLRGQRDLNHNVIYFDSRFNLCWYQENVSWKKKIFPIFFGA